VLVGRERQVDQLRRYVDALVQGRGALVLIVGDAGIGKTRLAEEAMEIAGAAGADAHHTTCWAEAGAPPFWPWSQLLRALGAAPLDTASNDAAPSDADRELARFRLFSNVSDTLREAASLRPRVLVLDDLHWADSASVRLLAFLASALRDAPVLLIATYRETEISGGSLGAALPDLVRHGRQLVVPPLGRDQLGVFVADVVGGTVSTDLVTRLFVLTEGNPLFAREVVSLLDARGAVDSEAIAELPVPESVRAILRRRLDAVSSACREVLGLASVLGVEFAIDVVAEVTGFASAALLAQLDEAHVARLVEEVGGGRFAFTHPLIRETAYGDLGLGRRVEMHSDVADALERIEARGGHVEPAELAHHFRHGSSDRALKAVAYDEAAGRRAMSMLAYEAAVAHFEHALETSARCTPDPERRAELFLQLGDARVAAGEMPAARAAFDEAAALARSRRLADHLARAALGYGSGVGGFEVPPFDAGQIDLVREALDALGDSDPATRSQLLARLSVARSLEDSDRERLGLAQEAVMLARDAGEDRALAYALAAQCDVLSGPTFCEQRLVDGGEIVALSRRNADSLGELLGRRLRVLALAELGRFADVDAEVAAYALGSDAIGRPLYAWYVPLWRGMRALMDGHFDDAVEWCAEAEAIGASAHSANAELLTFTLRIGWLICAGWAGDAYELCREIVVRYPALAFMLQPALSMAAARAGRMSDARAELARVDLSNPSEWGAEWLPAAAVAGEAAALCGDKPVAEALYRELLPFRHLFAIDGIAAANYGSLEHPLGMLAASLDRPDAARGHFDAALAAHRANRSPVLVARTANDRRSFLGAEDEPSRSRSGVFRREGEVWAVSYEGRTVRLRNSKGIADIASLLERPGVEVHVLDLAGAGQVSGMGGTGPRLDATARDAYKRRLIELEAEIDGADRAADAGRSELLHAERDALLGQLAGAYGLGGRERPTGDAAERARSAVTQRVRDAMARIEIEHRALGAHLRCSVRTGGFCVYEPDGPVDWEISHA
jgi:tetratricopeptide (TPR) repeat protein